MSETNLMCYNKGRKRKKRGGGVMDWGTVLQQYGFPIVCCIAMAWYVYDRGEKERIDRKESEQQHRAEVDKLSTIINNNTIAVTQLVDLIRKGDA